MTDNRFDTFPAHGVWSPALTPLDDKLSFDTTRLSRHVQNLLESGCHGVALFGTTGEANSFSVKERMAALEGGSAAVATASGLAANFVAITARLKSGDQIVSGSSLYGGTYTQFDVNLRNLGTNTTFVHPDQPENFRKPNTHQTRNIYA